MKRINVLKSIESILVEKAYEIGHRSQRKDGVYEKQQDGSWAKISSQPSGGGGRRSTPQKTSNTSRSIPNSKPSLTTDSDGYSALDDASAEKARTWIERNNAYFSDGDFDYENMDDLMDYLGLDRDNDDYTSALTNTIYNLGFHSEEED